MKNGIELISEERNRQIEKEGWTKEHDKEHVYGELALAAATYCVAENRRNKGLISFAPMWPFSEEDYKPTPNDRIRELVKAGALIAAEIDRLQNSKNILPENYSFETGV